MKLLFAGMLTAGILAISFFGGSCQNKDCYEAEPRAKSSCRESRAHHAKQACAHESEWRTAPIPSRKISEHKLEIPDLPDETGASITLPREIVLRAVTPGEEALCEKNGTLTVQATKDREYLVLYNKGNKTFCSWIHQEQWNALREQCRLQPLVDSIDELKATLAKYEGATAKKAAAVEKAEQTIARTTLALSKGENDSEATTKALHKVELRLAELMGALRERPE